MGTEGSGGDASFKAFSACFKNVVHAHKVSRQGEAQVLAQTGCLTPCVQLGEAGFLQMPLQLSLGLVVVTSGQSLPGICHQEHPEEHCGFSQKGSLEWYKPGAAAFCSKNLLAV